MKFSKVVYSGLLLTGGAFTSPIDTSIDGHHRPSRRWYGLQPWDQDAENNPMRMVPWPSMGKTNERTIRYCFKDKRSAKNLGDIVEEAIEGWEPAMAHSTLRITPDQGTSGDREVLCSDGKVAKDALIISDETKDGDTEWNESLDCPTVTTMGYKVIGEGKVRDEESRHILRFRHYSPDVDYKTKAFAIRSMMHELGHAIGLNHEHQRPDRGTYITFKCENLLGYVEMQEAVKKDNKLLWDWSDSEESESDGSKQPVSQQQREKMACQYARYARAYFPLATQYIKGGEPWWEGDQAERNNKGYHLSEKFDFESIMIYGSTMDANDLSRPVLYRKSDRSHIYQGGHDDDSKATISAGDIARVAQLYDDGTPECKKAQDLDNWGPMKAKI